jgi:hypothetical protein
MLLLFTKMLNFYYFNKTSWKYVPLVIPESAAATFSNNFIVTSLHLKGI